MSKAKITCDGGYTCCPDGHTPTTFAKGEVVNGEVAEWALADRAASRLMDKKSPPKNKAMTPPENKG